MIPVIYVRAVQENSSFYDGQNTPTRPILSCPPSVGHRVSRSNGALRYRWNTVHVVGVVLTYTVKMNACSIVCEAVNDVDDYSIPPGFSCQSQRLCAHPMASDLPIRLDRGAWKTAVDEKHITRDAIWGSGAVSELKPVFNSRTSIGNFIIIVCTNVIIAPDCTVACGVSGTDCA